MYPTVTPVRRTRPTPTSGLRIRYALLRWHHDLTLLRQWSIWIEWKVHLSRQAMLLAHRRCLGRSTIHARRPDVDLTKLILQLLLLHRAYIHLCRQLTLFE